MLDIIEKQRAYFLTGVTLDVDFRINQLKKLKNALHEFEPKLLEALTKDLGKPDTEGYVTELGVLFEEINYTLKHLRSWIKPKRVPTPLMHFISKSKIYTEPLGVVLIMSPWNYPLQLTIAPLIAAISAGNCAVVKPSRFSYYTSLVIEDMIKAHFPLEYISVFQGGSDVNTKLLEIKFDHIFFTGSPYVGKIVMEAAAKHLTPVTLELGGKSPCIVDDTADIELAAKRIVWGKLINAGQTCVAPDYILVNSAVKDKLIENLKTYIVKFYGNDILNNKDFPKIINEKHFLRLSGLLQSGQVVFGGKTDSTLNKIEPTILDNVTLESPIMQEEIFGPIIPVIQYNTIDEAISIIRKFAKPLALYIFTTSNDVERKFLKSISFGGGCVNDTIIHLTNPNMHFGGVGESGMGAYHGKKGFETFSHQKSILKKSNIIDVNFRYAPYNNKLALFKKLMK